MSRSAASGKVIRLIGLARRAGKVSSGDRAVRETLRKGNGHLVLVAEDAGQIANTMRTIAEKHVVPVRVFLDKNTLGNILGQRPRAVAVIEDKNLANEILNLLMTGTDRGDGV